MGSPSAGNADPAVQRHRAVRQTALVGWAVLMHSDKARQRTLAFVEVIAKWSMADVFVVALFIAYLAAMASRTPPAPTPRRSSPSARIRRPASTGSPLIASSRSCRSRLRSGWPDPAAAGSARRCRWDRPGGAEGRKRASRHLRDPHLAHPALPASSCLLPALPAGPARSALNKPRARTGRDDAGFDRAADRRVVAARDVAHEIGEAETLTSAIAQPPKPAPVRRAP